ncbi:hypothetical protein GIB67_018256 [Kingdonia uniflora]|uniref:Dirigent protein n=1 Tax=Kingdonia uniflora TaxID=39325 RepID=A0A7J7LES2_9MAGN|nr:hypothetical protein GIB67_018256 [Kingdonia uniflora]
MALNFPKPTLFLLVVAFTISQMVYASDPDITSDFVILVNASSFIDGAFFTYLGLRGVGSPGESSTSSAPDPNAKDPAATVISGFGSASAGTVSVPATIFVTSIDNGILTKSFKTDVANIQKIRAGLTVKT